MGDHELDLDINYSALNATDLPKEVDELKRQV